MEDPFVDIRQEANRTFRFLGCRAIGGMVVKDIANDKPTNIRDVCAGDFSTEGSKEDIAASENNKGGVADVQNGLDHVERMSTSEGWRNTSGSPREDKSYGVCGRDSTAGRIADSRADKRGGWVRKVLDVVL